MKSIFVSLLKPKAWVAKLLILAFFIGFYALGFMDYLDPIRKFLDSEELAFNLADKRFSVYILLNGAITLVLIFWFASIASDFAEKRMASFRRIKSSNRALIVKTIQILLYFVAATVGLNVLGFDLTTLSIFSGAVGIGVGFGLQKIASNFISGIILLFEKSIEEEDLVELSNGTVGFVRRTGARYTLLETPDSREVLVPNEDFVTNHVTNWTYTNTQGRIEFTVGISYDCDVDLAIELALKAASSHPRCIDKPAPVCFLREFGDNSINLLLQFWIADVTQGRYEPQSDVMRTLWRLYKENGISIPYPQRDVHIVSSEKAT
ncbi:mechanosensitive ion channel family protein [Kordiimonas aquimaris]|uniref:mechanosensitive ion channel family protein n=1 Tax=Kordiimonas aquimaris TaxID=707591 RepID=UPI0021D0FD41|nr:mechanosensitive ion channel domain-containing protein [Kordiimonas aquimaris]